MASLSLLLCSLALALTPLIFSTHWYRFNCQFHDRCPGLGPGGVERFAGSMGQYFLHRAPLDAEWDERGRLHLAEVRDIYDRLALVVLAAAAALVASTWGRAELWRRAGRNALLMLLLTLPVVPLFAPFWEKVFHPLLFDNDLWRTRPGEVLWQLTPRIVFRNAAIALITAAGALCAAAWWLGPRCSSTTR